MRHKQGLLPVGWTMMVLALVLAACSAPSEGESSDTASEADQGEATEEVSTTAEEGGEETSEPTAGADVEPQTVVIGQIAHLTGVGADPFGIPVDRGLQLGVQLVAESGYMDDVGVTLELRTEDDGTEATRAVTILNDYLRDEIPIAISSSFTPIATTLLPIANDEEVLLISVGSGGTGTDEEDYFFRMNDTITPVESVGEYLASEEGVQTPVAIIDGENAAFPPFAEAVERGLAAGGVDGGFAATETVSSDDTDFSSILTNLAQVQPDAVHIAATPAVVGNVIAQMRQVGGFEGAATAGGSGGGEQVFAVAGDAAVGTYFGQAWAEPVEAGDDLDSTFAAAYEEAYDASPTAFSALGHDAAWLLAVAIKQVVEAGEEVTGTAVRDALVDAATSQDYLDQALVDDFTIDATGRPTYPGVVATVDEEGRVVAAEGAQG